jgi:transcription factor E2F3
VFTSFVFSSFIKYRPAKLLSSLTAKIAVVEWNDLDTLHNDYVMPNVCTPQPQTPPSNPTEVPPGTNTTAG